MAGRSATHPSGWSGAPRDQDDALRARLQRPEVVVARERLDDEARRPRRTPTRSSGPTRRSRSTRTQRDRAPRRAPTPRRSSSGGRRSTPGRRSRCRSWSRSAPCSGSSRTHSSDEAAVVARQVVGVGQPRVDDREAARREVRGERRDRVGLVAARAHQEDRVQGDDRQPVACRRPARRTVAGVALDEAQATRDRRRRPRRPRAGPARASPGRGPRR